MKKYIRALETPFYLFVIAFANVKFGYTGIAVMLSLLSIIRLVVNVTTDDFVYKNNE